jgi:subtilisin family serine protease
VGFFRDIILPLYFTTFFMKNEHLVGALGASIVLLFFSVISNLSFGDSNPAAPNLVAVVSAASNQNSGTVVQTFDLNTKTSSQYVPDKYIVTLTQPSIAEKYASNSGSMTKSASLSQRSAIFNQQNSFLDSLPSSVMAKNSATKSSIGTNSPNSFSNALNAVVLNMTREEAESVKSMNVVKNVEPVAVMKVDLMDSVPLIHAPEVWAGKGIDHSVTGKGVKIAVIDTGVDYTHPDLGGCFGSQTVGGVTVPCKVAAGLDFYNGDSDPKDDMGHGTHVADIAAGNGTPKGVAPDATIYAYKVFNDQGYGSTAAILAGFDASLDPNWDGDISDHVDVINLSAGGYGNPDDSESTAVDNASRAGIVVVVAAGNAGPGSNTIGSPGTARLAVTVGATDKQDHMADFSSRGPVIWLAQSGEIKYLNKPDVVAPGVNICAARYASAFPQGITNCNNDNNHVGISGTSMATPHVAGEAALLRQLHPDWSSAAIKSAIRAGTISIGQTVPETSQGQGRIDLMASTQVPQIPIARLDPITVNNLSNTLSVKGDALSTTFSKYQLFYGAGSSATNPIGDGTAPVNNGVLWSSFNISSLTNGLYTMKLVVTDTSGNTSTDQIPFSIDRSILTGWPKKLPYFYNWQDSLTPALGDLDGDSVDDIVIHSFVGEYAYRGNGSALPGWPAYMHSPAYLTNAQIPNAGIFDIDKDGMKEIATNNRDYYAYQNVPSSYSYCFSVISKLGIYKTGWPQKCPQSNGNDSFNAIDSAPKIADLAGGQGKYQIISLEHPDHNTPIQTVIDVRNSDGTPYPGWPVVLDGYMSVGRPSDVEIADLDGDNKKEIVGMLQKSDGSYQLFVWNSNGTLKTGYPLSLPQITTKTSYPILTDINRDGRIDIGLITAYGNCYVGGGKLAYYNFDGTPIAGWPASFNSQFIAPSLTLADLDKDGNTETIFGTVGACNKPYDVYVFNSNGTVRAGWPQKIDGGVWSEASSADIDGDGYGDVLVTTDLGNVYAWKKDGTLIAGFPKNMASRSSGGVAVGDINGDGKTDIVSTTNDGGVFAWTTGGTYRAAANDWPGFMKDNQHSGCFKCNKILPVATPSPVPQKGQ